MQTIIGEVPTDWLLKCLTLLFDDGCLNAPLVSVFAAHGANLMCVILKRALLQVQLIMKHVNYKFLKGEVMKDCFKWCDWSNQPKKKVPNNWFTKQHLQNWLNQLYIKMTELLNRCTHLVINDSFKMYL